MQILDGVKLNIFKLRVTMLNNVQHGAWRIMWSSMH